MKKGLSLRQILFITLVLGLQMVLFLTSSAFADPATGGSTAPVGAPGGQAPSGSVPFNYSADDLRRFPWLDSSRYQSCGQSCLEGKGNEYISLGMANGFTKARMLSQLYQYSLTQSDAGRQNTQQAIRDNMRGFCGDPTQETLQDCLNRYYRVQAEIMRRSGQAIAKNDEGILQLTSDKFTVDGQMGVTAPIIGMPQDPNAQPKRPNLPYITTFANLKGDSALLQRPAEKLYDSEIEQMIKPPSPDEFVKYKEVKRDPDNPNSGTFKVIVTDEKGNPVPDREAYAKAMAAYVMQTGQRLAAATPRPSPGASPQASPSTSPMPQLTKADYQGAEKTAAQDRKIMESKDNYGATDTKILTKEMNQKYTDPASTYNISRDAFQQARMIMIDPVNDALKKAGFTVDTQVSYGDPAPAKGAQPAVTRTPPLNAQNPRLTRTSTSGGLNTNSRQGTSTFVDANNPPQRTPSNISNGPRPLYPAPNKEWQVHDVQPDPNMSNYDLSVGVAPDQANDWANDILNQQQ